MINTIEDKILGSFEKPYEINSVDDFKKTHFNSWVFINGKKEYCVSRKQDFSLGSGEYHLINTLEIGKSYAKEKIYSTFYSRENEMSPKIIHQYSLRCEEGSEIFKKLKSAGWMGEQND
jgi:hypothetical protein